MHFMVCLVYKQSIINTLSQLNVTIAVQNMPCHNTIQLQNHYMQKLATLATTFLDQLAKGDYVPLVQEVCSTAVWASPRQTSME